jgi:hypothetical protein
VWEQYPSEGDKGLSNAPLPATEKEGGEKKEETRDGQMPLSLPQKKNGGKKREEETRYGRMPLFLSQGIALTVTKV